MKVSIFIPDLAGGGAEKMMVGFANYLNKSTDHSVELLVARNTKVYLSSIDDGIKITSFDKKHTYLAVIPLYQHLKKSKPDVIYSTLMRANLMTITLGKLLGIKTIIREANTLAAYTRTKKTISSKVTIYLSKLLYKYADKYIAISQNVKKDLISFTNANPDKITVIYNPIIIVNKKNSISLDTDYLHVALVSRLTTQKNIPTIVEIIKEVSNRGLKVSFHFFGEGKESVLLEELKGKLDDPEMVKLHGFKLSYYSYLKHMQLFLHIPLWEGLGNSVLEAFNSGIPMILSNVESGYSELIKEEHSNIHYVQPLGKVMDIASLIEKYYNHEIAIAPDRLKLNLSVDDVFKKYSNLATNYNE